MPLILRSVNLPGRGPDGRPGPRVPAPGPVTVGLSGIGEGDLSARDDRALHLDDPARQPLAHALYAYPTVHHPVWRTMQAQAGVISFADAEQPLPPGSFDEDLALEGVEESQLWLGDRLRFPACEFVVSGPRLPDERFNETLGFAHACRLVAQSRWCGFWLAVGRTGTIAAGQAFELVPGPRDTGLVEMFRDLTGG